MYHTILQNYGKTDACPETDFALPGADATFPKIDNIQPVRANVISCDKKKPDGCDLVLRLRGKCAEVLEKYGMPNQP